MDNRSLTATMATAAILACPLALGGGCAPTVSSTAPPTALLAPGQPHANTWRERFARQNAAKAAAQHRHSAQRALHHQQRRAGQPVPVVNPRRWQAPPLPTWQPARCWQLNPRPCLLCKPVHPNPKIAALALDASC